ncbi:MAG TPA: type II toxin-antitoxin system HicB family antitoxin [Bacteroidota bacterium]
MKKGLAYRKQRGSRTRSSNRRESIARFMSFPYKVELTPIQKKDGGGYLAAIPLLKGCQSDGITPDEALENLREAQRAWFISARKHNDPIPVPQ